MKKSILTALSVCIVGLLAAQNNPPATNPPPQGTRNQGNTGTNQQGTGTGTNQQGTGTRGTGTQQGTGTNQQGIGTNQQGTSMQSVQPPGAVSKRFGNDYPNMSSNWSMSGNNYRAEYMDPKSNLGRAVIYDETGNPVGMEREIGKGEYPSTINEYYSSNFPNETSYRVWTTDDNTGKKNYFITRQNDVIWFDDKGAYTRKSTVTPDRPR